MADLELSKDEIRAHLRRVQASAGFCNADSIKRLLDFTVERTLLGESNQIKEYTLGLEVFGRKQSFDPRTDAIVRVQARKLRERLLAYYESEGAQESLRIEYHKGSYVPRIIPAQSPEATKPRSLAVIPFVNLGPDKEGEFLGDGITEELIFQLSQIESLRVVSRTSCWAVRGTTGDVRSLGQRLKANLIVEGTVRQSEKTVRITVQLIDAEDGYHLCSERWDSQISDLLAIQEEIASVIVKFLRPHLTAGAAAAQPTDDRDAYLLYVKGRHFWNQRSEHGFLRAIEHYEAALTRDPRFARAWSALSDVYFLMAAHHLDAPDVCMRKARQAAMTALTFDARLAPAHTALALVLMLFDRNPREAEREWKRALEIDPNYAFAWHSHAIFGHLLGNFGGVEDSLAALCQAESLEPLSAAICCDFAFVYYYGRRYEEAIQAARRALDLHPSFSRTYVALARSLAAQDRFDEAIAACLEGRPLFRGRAFLGQLLATLGHSYGRSGRMREAEGVLDEFRNMGQEHYVSACDVALVHAGMGDREKTMQCLQAAVKERAFWLIALPADALFDRMRGEAGFDQLLSDLCHGIK